MMSFLLMFLYLKFLFTYEIEPFDIFGFMVPNKSIVGVIPNRFGTKTNAAKIKIIAIENTLNIYSNFFIFSPYLLFVFYHFSLSKSINMKKSLLPIHFFYIKFFLISLSSLYFFVCIFIIKILFDLLIIDFFLKHCIITC